MKGNYIVPNVRQSLEQRLAGISKPEWVQAMITLIQSKQNSHEQRVHGGKPDSRFFRWHDSGDLQSIEHLSKIAAIARALPEIHFWLPTREYQLVERWLRHNTKPDNLNIRLSGHLINGPLPTKLADKLGVTSSGVHHNQSPVDGAIECMAYTRGDDCGDCRLCWNPQVKAISYKKH